MGFDDDEDPYDAMVKAYKIVMKELISRADIINMVKDDDYIRIIVGRSFDKDMSIERHDGKFLRDIIEVTENGLLISNEDILRYKVLKGFFKLIPTKTTVTNTTFLPWNLITDIRLEHHHHQRNPPKDDAKDEVDDVDE